jgi:cytochrome c biogenesis protein CcmG/thiol:disulfide interchange protein DsbE
LVAAATMIAVLAIVALTRPPGPASPGIEKGKPVPDIAGTTLDGSAFALADLRGRPVIVNFWGPSCVPCLTEFPLLQAKLTQHAATGLAIVGILTDDPPEPARDFVRHFGATWPTVIDPERAIKAAWRVAARPQTYFVDRTGVLRSIQVGELTDGEFERQLALIAS